MWLRQTGRGRRRFALGPHPPKERRRSDEAPLACEEATHVAWTLEPGQSITITDEARDVCSFVNLIITVTVAKVTKGFWLQMMIVVLFW